MNARSRQHALCALHSIVFGRDADAFRHLSQGRVDAAEWKPSFRDSHVRISDTHTAGHLLRASVALAAGRRQDAVAEVCDLVGVRPPTPSPTTSPPT